MTAAMDMACTAVMAGMPKMIVSAPLLFTSDMQQGLLGPQGFVLDLYCDVADAEIVLHDEACIAC